MSLSNLCEDIFTIINQIPASQTVATKVAWKQYRLTNCGKRDGLYDKSSGTMVYRANTWTAYIHDWEKYKNPNWLTGGYYALPDGKKAEFYTVNVGDLLIFADITDSVPTTLQEFSALRDKYKDCGGIITGVEAYISYKPDMQPWQTNHIEVIKA